MSHPQIVKQAQPRPAVRADGDLLLGLSGIRSSMLELCPLPSLILCEDGLILEANAALHSFVGYGQGELDGQHISILMTSEVARRHDALYGRAFEKRGDASSISRACCTQLLKKDGTEVQVSIDVVVPAQVAGAKLAGCFIHTIPPG